MATDEQQILVRLAVLAEQCGEPVSEARVEFTARRLLPLGGPAVCRALDELLETARRFPTVGEVKAAMGLADIPDEGKARDVGERIWTAIGKFGWVNGSGDSAMKKLADVSAFVGEVGDEVVKLQGGWNRVCEMATNDNAIALKAQWRELALVLVKKSRSGSLDKPPEFAPLPEHARREMKQLEARFTPYRDD